MQDLARDFLRSSLADFEIRKMVSRAERQPPTRPGCSRSHPATVSQLQARQSEAVPTVEYTEEGMNRGIKERELPAALSSGECVSL